MRRRHIWTIITALLVSLASGPSTMLYANRVAAQAERRATQVAYENELKWCSVVNTMNAAYRESPPQTPTGKQLARNMTALSADLRCPPAPHE